MTSEPSVSRLIVPLIVLFLTFAAVHAPVHAAEDLREVPFGQFGDQDVCGAGGWRSATIPQLERSQ
jgi:hypothetical protein